MVDYEDRQFAQEGDLIDVENWRNPEESKFNHQTLVMTAMKNCIANGSVELREGWWDEKVDKLGNVRRQYNQDTRKVFIESVKSLLMIIAPDMDEEAMKNITEIKKKIDQRRAYWLNEEFKWWNSLSPSQQSNLAKEGKNVVKGFFNSKLNFDNYFFEDELDLYREICLECNKLTYRLNYYGEVMWTA